MFGKMPAQSRLVHKFARGLIGETHCRRRRVQLIYRPDEPEGSLQNLEFSRPTMELRWEGLADARMTLQASPWLAPMPTDVGVRVFDVIQRDQKRRVCGQIAVGVCGRNDRNKTAHDILPPRLVS